MEPIKQNKISFSFTEKKKKLNGKTLKNLTNKQKKNHHHLFYHFLIAFFFIPTLHLNLCAHISIGCIT